MSKIKNILKGLNVINEPGGNNLLTNLTKTPPKEKDKVMPHYTNSQKNSRHQLDILYLPEDQGYKYLLVVVDIATRLIDAQALKVRDAKTTRDALKKIYARKILSLPTYDLQVDGGTEFRGEFQKYFSKIVKIFTKIPGRSRQQSVVEAKNKTIGTVVNSKMLADEINTGETSKSWVDIIPDAVKLINKEYAKAPDKPKIDAPLKIDKLNKQLLPVNTKVRIKLDVPRDYVSGSKLGGKNFRVGDIRWDKEIRTITQVYLNPGEAPAYQIDGNTAVSYTRPQIQVIDDGEVLPNSNRQYAQRITDKRTEKGKVFYQVEWENREKSWEKFTNIKEDLKEMIKEYNDSNKK
jgi:hypothetical protein